MRTAICQDGRHCDRRSWGNSRGCGKSCKRLSADSLGRLSIPVPPLYEQERIVSILDKLDTLVNNFSFGLPAEIKARRQQYEHYRDRLLTFRDVA